MATYKWTESPKRDTFAWYLTRSLRAKITDLSISSGSPRGSDGRGSILPAPLEKLPETLVAANTVSQTIRHGRVCELSAIQAEPPTKEQAAAFADIKLPPNVFEEKFRVFASAAEAKGIEILIHEHPAREGGTAYQLAKAPIFPQRFNGEKKKHYKGVKRSCNFPCGSLLGSKSQPLRCDPQLSASMASLLGGEGMATIFTPSQPLLTSIDINYARLRAVLRENSSRCLDTPDSLVRRSSKTDAKVQFMNEILWRCVYISQFKECSGSYICEPPLPRPIDMYYPHLGPNIGLDTFIYEQGILEDGPNFDYANNTLVKMYGFGKQEIRWLLQNPDPDERAEQISTLERYHVLQSWLGRLEVEDLVEQLQFCWYAVRDSKGTAYQRMPWAKREACVRARRRELSIAKVMVDRIWNEVNENGGCRRIPGTLRKRYWFGDDGSARVVRQGDWRLLAPQEKRRLLGEQTSIYPEHDDYPRLLKASISEENPRRESWPGANRNGRSPSRIKRDWRRARDAQTSPSRAHAEPLPPYYAGFPPQVTSGPPWGTPEEPSMTYSKRQSFQSADGPWLRGIHEVSECS